MNEDLSELDVIEPGYYFRVETDMRLKAPAPFIFKFDLAGLPNDQPPGGILEMLLQNISSITEPRLVLDMHHSEFGTDYRGGPEDLYSWAVDSASSWGEGVVKKYLYLSLPAASPAHIPAHWDTQYNVCKSFLYHIPGNRSCFDKCK